MALFLKRQKKSILRLLAAEFGLEVSDSALVKDIIKDISEASDYDEETAKAFLDRILEEESARLELAERERLEKIAERERLEKLAERDFELERLRLTSAAERNSFASASGSSEEGSRRVNLKDLVPKFDPKVIDIALFFMIFERQAKKENIDESKWVSQLIPLLPAEVSELIVKEPEEMGDNYPHMKRIIMKRFKLSPVALRLKFEEHQRKAGMLWSDLVYELRGYLESWLESAEVKDFQSLKNLILTEQVKKRVPPEIREHFLDSWEECREASELANKLDHYESVRRTFRKTENKPWERRPFEKGGQGQTNSKDRGEGKQSSENAGKRESQRNEPKGNCDKRKEVICYACKLPGHIRPSCPSLQRNSEHIVCNLQNSSFLGESFKPFVGKATINGVPNRRFLKDSGSSIDICVRSWVRAVDFTGEVTWVRQPLDKKSKRLPLARVVIEGDFGRVVTKAAIKADDLDQGFYLLGNKTAQLIEKMKQKPIPVNSVVTRSQALRDSQSQRESGERQHNTVSDPPLTLTEKDRNFLPKLSQSKQTGLAHVPATMGLEERKVCCSPSAVLGRGKKERDPQCKIRTEGVMCNFDSKRDERRIRLCIPTKSGQLGTSKARHRSRHDFLWENCYRNVGNQVKLCDACQKVGKFGDKSKTPIWLSPMIIEVCGKRNVDAVRSQKTYN